MFLEFYGLREQPFGATPDPRFLYLSPAHREALAALIYGIDAARGFLALIAKPGMGKTTLLFQLLKTSRRSARTVLVFQTQCTSREFMRFVLMELGCEFDRGQDLVTMHDAFNRCLLQEARAGRRLMLVVDEAHNLEPSVLETVRLLSNFETPQAKLLQIVLAGQPQLADKLARPALRQLRQRISFLSTVAPLPAEEVERYIDHRLWVAGYRNGCLFTSEAQKMIAELSEGVPRCVNNLCFSALSLGCALKEGTIGRDIISEIAADSDVRNLRSEFAGTRGYEMTGFPSLTAEKTSTLCQSGPVSSHTRNDEFLTPEDALAYIAHVIQKLKVQ
jgi:general secretion pathway protein A